MYEPIPYHITAVVVYACILTIIILALIYGRRARRNVKREKVTALPRGFSPLDVQRIFIGKTYPRKLTRALIVHWAQLGYIRVTQVSKHLVRLMCIKKPPTHSNEKAVFLDRGTYVRERDIFIKLFPKDGAEKTVNINKPLISRDQANFINGSYAVREDEGVYSSKHYKLKVFTFILALLPFFMCGIYCSIVGKYTSLFFPIMMLLGMFVFRFAREIPFWFRLVWSALWVTPSVAFMIVEFNGILDPWLLGYASVAALFIGSFILIRFVDYREKNNLSDYSDLINYKRFLIFSGREKLKNVDYYEALPYIYAFNIKFLVKRKFLINGLPEWYENLNGKRGRLLW